MLLSKAAKPSGQPDWYQPIYDIASHPLSGYHQMLNTGEHQEEALLQNLMAGSASLAQPRLKHLAPRAGTSPRYSAGELEGIIGSKGRTPPPPAAKQASPPTARIIL